jgi:hypothetical protein
MSHEKVGQADKRLSSMAFTLHCVNKTIEAVDPLNPERLADIHVFHVEVDDDYYNGWYYRPKGDPTQSARPLDSLRGKYRLTLDDLITPLDQIGYRVCGYSVGGLS